MKKLVLLFLLIMGNLSIYAQTPTQFMGFKVTPKTGIYYKFCERSSDKTAKKFGANQAMDFHLVVKNYKDSVIQSTYEIQPIKNFIYQPPTFNGDIAEVLKYVAEGDSVIIAVSSDSTAKHRGHPLPKFFPKGTYIKFFLKILRVKSAAEAKAEMARAKQVEKERIRRNDSINIQQYIVEKELTDKVKATPSGLHYVVLKEGTGDSPQPKDTAYAYYAGWLTDGKLFDTNIEAIGKKSDLYGNSKKYKAFSFLVGLNQVIKGWEEGIRLMKKGGKTLFILPSTLAYGSRAMGNRIPSNSVLVFEVKLVDIKKGE